MKSIQTIIIGISFISLSCSQNREVICLRRTACYGQCPIYCVTIFENGDVDYEGKEHVKVQGKLHFIIPKDSVDYLLKNIQAIQFFSLDDSYIVRITTKMNKGGNVDTTAFYVTDLPSTYITVMIGSKKKTILDYYGAPSELRNLEVEIDRVTQTSRYIE